MAKFDDEELALEALDHLAPWRTDDREAWLKVGMALHSVDEGLLDYWDGWSQQSEKYRPKECARQWRSFKADGGIGLGSLIAWARADSGIPDPGSSRARAGRKKWGRVQ